MLLILFMFPVPILQYLRMKKRTTWISLTFPPLSLVPVLVTTRSTSAQSCSHFCLGFQPFWFWLCCHSNVLILKSSETLVLSPAPLKEWIRSPLSVRLFREICSSSGSAEESVFYAVWVYCFLYFFWPPAFWSACQVRWTVICFVPRLIRCWCIRHPPAVLMFLLPRVLFIVCWWARFDTLVSWVDWFPLHTRPLFVMCLVAFASVLFGAIALIPLGGGHSP